MNRLFSIRRRRPNIVDVYTPVQTAVDGYRLKWAQNFDGTFATIITSSKVGYLDPNVNRNVIETQPTAGRDVRIVFDPVTHTIDDTKAFWLQFFPVINNVEQTPGAPTLVLPSDANHGVGVVIIQGTAPTGTPLQLDLPMLMQEIRISNEDASNDLLVAMEDGGPQMHVEPAPTVGTQTLSIFGTQGSIYVEGDGATVDFSATFTLAFPR